jgi:hypothetical protein
MDAIAPECPALRADWLLADGVIRSRPEESVHAAKDLRAPAEDLL